MLLEDWGLKVETGRRWGWGLNAESVLGVTCPPAPTRPEQRPVAGWRCNGRVWDVAGQDPVPPGCPVVHGLSITTGPDEQWLFALLELISQPGPVSTFDPWQFQHLLCHPHTRSASSIPPRLPPNPLWCVDAHWIEISSCAATGMLYLPVQATRRDGRLWTIFRYPSRSFSIAETSLCQDMGENRMRPYINS